MKKPTYLLFVDLTAAFDHVRKWMFQSIYQRLPPGEDTTLIELLEALLTVFRSKTRGSRVTTTL